MGGVFYDAARRAAFFYSSFLCCFKGMCCLQAWFSRQGGDKKIPRVWDFIML